jgi:Lactate racemase N-terminal domain
MIERFAPDANLPRQVLVEARIASRRLDDPAAAVTAQLTAALGDRRFEGQRIVIGVGSRGIDRIQEVVRSTVAFIRARGGQPAIIPAMGNHGGATDEGQQGILEGLGITEASVGAPIRPRMTTRQVGTTPSGIPVYLSVEALEADHVVLVNRVKPHTDFESERLGSGLIKMSAIGFGRSEGAAASHRAGIRLGLETALLEVSRVSLAHLPVLAGIALIEDGLHQLSRVEVMQGSVIHDREPSLLRDARALMPSLPFERIDVLVIDWMGKDISGAGLDTNIIGRGIDGMPRASRHSDIGAIYARDLTPASHGNAIGLGICDVVSNRLVESIDTEAMFTNALSAMTPVTPKLPMHFKSDRDCLRAALRFSGSDSTTAGIVRIRSTLALNRFIASDNYASQIAGNSNLTVVDGPIDWRFDSHGDFDANHDLLATAAASAH